MYGLNSTYGIRTRADHHDPKDLKSSALDQLGQSAECPRLLISLQSVTTQKMCSDLTTYEIRTRADLTIQRILNPPP